MAPKKQTEKIFFQIEKPIKKNDDKSAYGFGNWDYDSILQAIEQLKTGNMPRFILSKVEIHPSGFCNLSCPSCSGCKL